MNNRIEQLDSIRGLAALFVFFSHIYSTSDSIQQTLSAKWSLPLQIFFNGESAVILFFLLSGFVLSIPFIKKDEVNYVAYLTKRIFRIYVPYIIAITIAMFISQFFINDDVSQINNWLDKFWKSAISTKLILEHILFIGNIHSGAFDSVIWSLIHEMRISLIFPFVVLWIKSTDFKKCILVCLSLSFVGGLNNIYHFQLPNGNLTTYFDSLGYLSIFILGSLLAIHKEKLISFAKNMQLGLTWIMFGVSYILYNFSNAIIHHFLHWAYESPYFLALNEYGIALGASGFILLALSSIKVEKFLMMKPILFLGKISYSLYLYHFIVMLTVIHLFHDQFPLSLMLLISFIAGLIISSIAWFYVERPCMNLGRHFASLLTINKSHKLKSEKASVS